MKDAFGFSLEPYLYGGYPGAAPLAEEPDRWRRYILDALVETTIARDVLLLSRVDKPALLRRLFESGCRYSGQVLSYNKMLGQLQDAGNTTTLAHHLQLLGGAGLLVGLVKYAGQTVRQRGSSPKFQVLNTALMSALAGLSFEEARADRRWWGRLVESAVGVHLANAAAGGKCQLFYWRERNQEVDFVARTGRALAAIEVKSGKRRDIPSGMGAFSWTFQSARRLLVGGEGEKVFAWRNSCSDRSQTGSVPERDSVTGWIFPLRSTTRSCGRGPDELPPQSYPLRHCVTRTPRTTRSPREVEEDHAEGVD